MNKRVPVVKQMWIKQILDFKKIKHFTVALLRDAYTQCTPLMWGGGLGCGSQPPRCPQWSLLPAKLEKLDLGARISCTKSGLACKTKRKLPCVTSAARSKKHSSFYFGLLDIYNSEFGLLVF